MPYSNSTFLKLPIEIICLILENLPDQEVSDLLKIVAEKYNLHNLDTVRYFNPYLDNLSQKFVIKSKVLPGPSRTGDISYLTPFPNLKLQDGRYIFPISWSELSLFDPITNRSETIAIPDDGYIVSSICQVSADLVLTGGINGNIHRLNIKNKNFEKQSVAKVPNRPSHMCILPNNKLVVATGINNEVILIDLQRKTEKVLLEEDCMIVDLFPLKNSNRFVCLNEKGSINVWDNDGFNQTNIMVNTRNDYIRFNRIIELGYKLLAVGNSDNEVQVFNYHTKEKELHLDGPEKSFSGNIISLIALPGDRIAAGSNDNKVYIWKSESSKNTKLEATLEGHTNRVLSLKLLEDGRLASGSSDSTVRIWNLKTYKCDEVINCAGGGVYVIDQPRENVLITLGTKVNVFLRPCLLSTPYEQLMGLSAIKSKLLEATTGKVTSLFGGSAYKYGGKKYKLPKHIYEIICYIDEFVKRAKLHPVSDEDCQAVFQQVLKELRNYQLEVTKKHAGRNIDLIHWVEKEVKVEEGKSFKDKTSEISYTPKSSKKI